MEIVFGSMRLNVVFDTGVSDGVGSSTNGQLVTSRLWGYNGSQYDRLRSLKSSGDGIGVLAVGHGWDTQIQSDVVENQNDKTVTVPANEEWEILWIQLQYTCSATVGNRALQLDFRNGSDSARFRTRLAVNLVALDDEFVIWVPGYARETAIANSIIYQPIPPASVLTAGFDIRIFDQNDIDTNDNMSLHIYTTERQVP